MGNLTNQLENMITESLHDNTIKNHSPINICPICHNNGWEIVFCDDSQPYAIECKCGIRRRMIHDSRLKFASIPNSMKDVRLNNFKKTVYKRPESQEMIVDVAKAVRYFLHNFESMKERGIGLYIYSGTKGSGKTRLVVSIANELIEKYKESVKFTTSMSVLDEIRKTWSENKSDSDLIKSLSETDILIIDDFGVEQEKGWINEKFYSIINGRYIDKKITIFTSNSRLDDLHYDDRITNRIKERVLQIPFPEESVRDHLAEELNQELLEGMNNG